MLESIEYQWFGHPDMWRDKVPETTQSQREIVKALLLQGAKPNGAAGGLDRLSKYEKSDELRALVEKRRSSFSFNKVG